MTRTRIGILGFGSLGHYLCQKLLGRHGDGLETMELAFVWSRSSDRFGDASVTVPESRRLSGRDLGAAVRDWTNAHGRVDLIAEVCHPQVVAEWGLPLLGYADLLVGSPTAFASSSVETAVRERLAEPAQRHGCYLASGALWGVEDIAKMKELGTLNRLSVTMKKHPKSFKLGEPLHSQLQAYANDPTQKDAFVIYDGPVRELCPLAPNNVNTMACAAMAGLGFDQTRALLVADKALRGHIIDIDIEGNDGFSVRTQRHNPAREGAVTGAATYDSFLASLKRAGGKGPGFHFC